MVEVKNMFGNIPLTEQQRIPKLTVGNTYVLCYSVCWENWRSIITSPIIANWKFRQVPPPVDGQIGPRSATVFMLNTLQARDARAAYR